MNYELIFTLTCCGLFVFACLMEGLTEVLEEKYGRSKRIRKNRRQ